MYSTSQGSSIHGSHVCYCGIDSPMRTSWSDSNPGRRFFGCNNYGVYECLFSFIILISSCDYYTCKFQTGNACSFFIWIDPPMQPRAKAVILGLLRKLNTIERERDFEKRKLEGKAYCCRISCLIVVIVCALCLGVVIF